MHMRVVMPQVVFTFMIKKGNAGICRRLLYCLKMRPSVRGLTTALVADKYRHLRHKA